MEEFAWATNNLGPATPQELQERGVQVFFAPNISPNSKVVDLSNGGVMNLDEDATRISEGVYAEFESLERYCRREGIPLIETSGFLSTQPMGSGEAGDPLRKRGH